MQLNLKIDNQKINLNIKILQHFLCDRGLIFIPWSSLSAYLTTVHVIPCRPCTQYHTDWIKPKRQFKTKLHGFILNVQIIFLWNCVY